MFKLPIHTLLLQLHMQKYGLLKQYMPGYDGHILHPKYMTITLLCTSLADKNHGIQRIFIINTTHTILHERNVTQIIMFYYVRHACIFAMDTFAQACKYSPIDVYVIFK